MNEIYESFSGYLTEDSKKFLVAFSGGLDSTVLLYALKQALVKEKLNKEVPLKDRCQFSWYCDGKADIIRDQDAYELALAVAHQVLSGYLSLIHI